MVSFIYCTCYYYPKTTSLSPVPDYILKSDVGSAKRDELEPSEPGDSPSADSESEEPPAITAPESTDI